MSLPSTSKMIRTPQGWSRRGAIVAGLAACASACAGTRGRPVPQVLFVCQFATVKSAIAREVFRKRAAERGLAVSAISRGITVEHHTSAQLQQALAAEGIDPAKDGFQTLTAQDWHRDTIVVAFNTLPDEVKPRDLRYWTDLPSFNDAYAIARPLLNARIDALLDEIAKRSAGR